MRIPFNIPVIEFLREHKYLLNFAKIELLCRMPINSLSNCIDKGSCLTALKFQNELAHVIKKLKFDPDNFKTKINHYYLELIKEKIDEINAKTYFQLKPLFILADLESKNNSKAELKDFFIEKYTDAYKKDIIRANEISSAVRPMFVRCLTPHRNHPTNYKLACQMLNESDKFLCLCIKNHELVNTLPFRVLFDPSKLFPSLNAELNNLPLLIAFVKQMQCSVFISKAIIIKEL